MYLFVPNLKEKVVKPEQAAHFFSLHSKAGDTLKATDLQGNLAEIKISQINKSSKSIEFEILNWQKEPKPKDFSLFQAVIDKLYLEKMCEIVALCKITQIYLFYSQNSVKQNIPLERLDKILVRSCEQCQRVWKPELKILEKSEFTDKLQELQPIVLHTEILSKNNANQNSNTSILVGPEGGWDKAEIEHFKSLNLAQINLGKTIYPAWLAGFMGSTKLDI